MTNNAFSALTVLAEHQKDTWPAKNWVVRCWRGDLSGVRCKWSAYGPANATATSSSLASLKSRLVQPFWCRLTQVVLEEAVKRVFCCSMATALWSRKPAAKCLVTWTGCSWKYPCNRSLIDADQRPRQTPRWPTKYSLPAGCGFLGCGAAWVGAEAVVTGTCTCGCCACAWPWCFTALTPFLGIWLGETVHVTPGICGRPTGGLLASGELRHSSRNARS